MSSCDTAKATAQYGEGESKDPSAGEEPRFQLLFRLNKASSKAITRKLINLVFSTPKKDNVFYK